MRAILSVHLNQDQSGEQKIAEMTQIMTTLKTMNVDDYVYGKLTEVCKKESLLYSSISEIATYLAASKG